MSSAMKPVYRSAHARLLALLAALAATVSLGCAGAADPTPAGDVDPALSSGENASTAPRLTPESFALGPFVEQLQDSQILGVLSAVNIGQISQGLAAGPRAEEARVETYANQIVTDYAAEQQHEVAVFALYGRQPAPSPLSALLTFQSSATLTTLSAVPPGWLFDRSFIDAQISFESQVLLAIDLRLLPDASNAPLRQEVARFRSVVANHLALARGVRAYLP